MKRMDAWLFAWRREYAGRAARWLFPPRCLMCDEAGAGTLDLCLDCLAALPWLGPACPACALPLPMAGEGVRCGACLGRSPQISAVRAAFVYQWPVDALLRRFKFQGDLVSGRLLAQLMLREVAPACAGSTVLVPVPLHSARLRQRGYDQALELARALATALALRCVPMLQRQVATHAQSELDAVARRRNVQGAFRCVAPATDHVVLVDDVMTTGTTLDAAALTLREAGVARVDAWVCARVP